MVDRRLLAGWLLVMAGLAAACNSSFDDFCTKSTQCAGGNDKDKQSCIDNAEGAKSAASDYGCSSQFDDSVKCIESNSKCADSGAYGITVVVVSGGDGGVTTSDPCSTQSDALSACVKAATGVKQNQPGH